MRPAPEAHEEECPKYVFMLQCCFEDGCVHPVCKEGLLQNETRYPGGPSLAFLPLPVPDINHPFNGASCNECGTQCNGHYMKYDEALARFREDRKTDFVQPPSVVILETYNKYKSIPPRAVLLETAQATLLPEDEVAIWLQHLHEKAENRCAGAKKPAITRREKKVQNKTVLQKVVLLQQKLIPPWIKAVLGSFVKSVVRKTPPVVKRRPFRGFHVMAAFYGGILLALVLTWRLD